MSLPKRGIKLHEYQAAQLLHKYRVPVPLGNVAYNSDEAYLVAKQFGEKYDHHFVVKAQVLGGGRGLGSFKENGFKGGVHIVEKPDEVKDIADKMCGKTLVTKQSGAAGLKCNCVYIVQKLAIDKEYYLSITLDRAAGCPVIIYSPEGGMSIEDVAKKNPEKIFKIHVDPLKELNIDDLLKAAQDLGLEEENKSQFVFMMKHMMDCFMECDADLIEINPLVKTKDDLILAADSKITIDDNAAFRQKELKSNEDKTQQNYKERIAQTFDLNYIHIGGNIGCLVNGAGLAMSTMDIIKLYGGNPANFLDVGGNAEPHQLLEAIKLLSNDPEVESIFVNIFGGILRCDNIATSLIDAADQISLAKPIVLRLKGTNSDIAREMIIGKEKQLNIYFDDDLDQAARKVVDIASERHY